jgi:hypothetical protein
MPYTKHYWKVQEISYLMVCLLGSLDHGCDGASQPSTAELALGPKIPIVNTAFMDLRLNSVRPVLPSNAARYTTAHETSVTRIFVIAADSASEQVSRGTGRKHLAASPEPAVQRLTLRASVYHLYNYVVVPLPCGPSGADEARTGDLHHDEQWISLDSCELRNVHRTQRYVDGRGFR